MGDPLGEWCVGIMHPGTSSYEWFVSDDGGVVHIQERYEDSAVTVIHPGAFREKFAARFLAAVDPNRFTGFGNPTDEARAVLDGFGATPSGVFNGSVR
jgi:hypothetical protein